MHRFGVTRVINPRQHIALESAEFCASAVTAAASNSHCLVDHTAGCLDTVVLNPREQPKPVGMAGCLAIHLGRIGAQLRAKGIQGYGRIGELPANRGVSRSGVAIAERAGFSVDALQG